jgi:hypothetical protein
MLRDIALRIVKCWVFSGSTTQIRPCASAGNTAPLERLLAARNNTAAACIS